MKLIFELFFTFFKMGLFTFGGGLAMLPFITDLVVNKKKWLTEEETLEGISLCQALPGIIAINLAIFIGTKRKGFIGALASTLGVILPSFIIIILVILFLGTLENNPYVNGAFEGVKAAAVGLIAVATYQVGKQVLKTKFSWAIALVSFFLIVILDVSAIFSILLGGFAGYFMLVFKKLSSRWHNKRGEK